MGNPWKNFTALPSTRKVKRDGPLTRTFVTSSLALVIAVIFGLAGSCVYIRFLHSAYEYDPPDRSTPSYREAKKQLWQCFGICAAAGGLLGVAAAFQTYRILDRRNDRTRPR